MSLYQNNEDEPKDKKAIFFLKVFLPNCHGLER